MTVSLWVEASRDVEAEESALRMSRAKVATASLWPFLSLAQSEPEFNHRLALAADRIAERVEPDLFEPVLASLREDFRITAADGGEDAEVESEEDDEEWEKPWEKKGSLQVFHHASQTWITVHGASEQPITRDNPQSDPAYFENATEEGPNTGQTGQFPMHPTGVDPMDPINGMFPMQPTAWSGEGKPAWNDNEMNFAPYRQAAANPNYFSGGPEGASGEDQGGFPTDDALPEPDERVDMYGTVPPLQSGGTGPGQTQGYTNSEVTSRQAAQEPRPFSEGRGFYDPADTGVRMIAVGGPYGSGNAYNTSGSEVGIGSVPAPTPPPTMLPTGPGAQAMPAMQSTPDGSSSPSDQAAKETGGDPTGQIAPTARRRVAIDEVRERPNIFNPAGVQDEYDDNTWDNPAKQRPMQPAEHRNVNTPQQPGEPIPQSSSTPDRFEDEGDRRAASLRQYASWVSNQAILAVMGRCAA